MQTMLRCCLAGFCYCAIVMMGSSSSTASERVLLSKSLKSADAPSVQAVYAVARDGIDRHLDTNGALAHSIISWESWLRSQTGGRAIRLARWSGEPSIAFIRLSATEAELLGKGVWIRDAMEAELARNGYLAPGNVYAVYYDGPSNGQCGGGAWPPSLKGNVAALYLRGTFPNASTPPCASHAFAGPGEPPRYLEFAMLHEILHTMGYVATCAPHHTQRGHVSDDPTDLMYAGPLPWKPATLDVNHDDYFGHGRKSCPDLARDPMLVREFP